MLQATATALAFAQTPSQNTLNVTNSVERVLRVEYSHRYSKADYQPHVPFDVAANASLSAASVEATTVEYLGKLARGSVAEAVGMWDEASQELIKRRNAGLPPERIAEAARRMNAGTRVRFMSKISYGDYVIVDVEQSRSNGSTVEKESFVLVKINGSWKLTQALADDPVACCWTEPTGRIFRVGVPGGEFKRVLEELRK